VYKEPVSYVIGGVCIHKH